MKEDGWMIKTINMVAHRGNLLQTQVNIPSIDGNHFAYMFFGAPRLGLRPAFVTTSRTHLPKDVELLQPILPSSMEFPLLLWEK